MKTKKTIEKNISFILKKTFERESKIKNRNRKVWAPAFRKATFHCTLSTSHFPPLPLARHKHFSNFLLLSLWLLQNYFMSQFLFREVTLFISIPQGGMILFEITTVGIHIKGKSMHGVISGLLAHLAKISFPSFYGRGSIHTPVSLVKRSPLNNNPPMG